MNAACGDCGRPLPQGYGCPSCHPPAEEGGKSELAGLNRKERRAEIFGGARRKAQKRRGVR